MLRVGGSKRAELSLTVQCSAVQTKQGLARTVCRRGKARMRGSTQQWHSGPRTTAPKTHCTGERRMKLGFQSRTRG